MNRLKIAIGLFILGSFFLLIATYILTITLSNLEQRITETRDSIDKQLSKREYVHRLVIIYEIQYVEYRLYESQRNILIQTNATNEAIEYLTKRTEREIGKLAAEWHQLAEWYILGAGKELDNFKLEILKKIDKIKKNPSLNHHKKIENLEKFWIEGVNKFKSRQNESKEPFYKNKQLLVTLKGQIANWQNYFTWFQILGLILIFLSQLFEKSFVKPAREIAV